jgi:hypothetical protein
MGRKPVKKTSRAAMFGLFKVIGFIFIFPFLFLATKVHNKIYRPAKHALFIRFGEKTTGAVIESSRCEGEDWVGMRGVFRFHDSRGRPHDFKFELCDIHRPSVEQWALVKQTYSLGSVSEVYYLRHFPFLYEIQFAAFPQ